MLRSFNRKPVLDDSPPVQDFSLLALHNPRYRALIKLQQERQIVEVIHNQYRLQSIVLYVNPGQGVFTLDELFPEQESPVVVPGDQLTLRHHNNGRILAVTATVINVEHTSNRPYFILKLPESVEYHQRRSSERVTMSQAYSITARLKKPMQNSWVGRIQNLSTGGMRVAVSGNLLRELYHGVSFHRCEFQFTSEFAIQCQAIVRGFRFVRHPYRHTQLNLAFQNLPTQQAQQLQLYIQHRLENAANAA